MNCRLTVPLPKFRAHGVHTLTPLVCRGALLDVARYQAKDVCAPGYEISPADLEGTMRAQDTNISPGDVILIRTGWGTYFDDPHGYLGRETGVPGPGLDAVRWLVDHQPSAVGADTIAFEYLAPDKGLSRLPGHKVLLVDYGIPIIETLSLEALAASGTHEFLFILSPLNIVGATASPVRPLAVVTDHE